MHDVDHDDCDGPCPLCRPGSAGDWLRPGFVFPENGFSLETAIDQLVAKAVRQADGNVSAAARLLGVSRDVVRYRLKTTGAADKAGE